MYCLPDNYEVSDRSLDDIRHVLNPSFSSEEVGPEGISQVRLIIHAQPNLTAPLFTSTPQIPRLDVDVKWARALDGTEYMPGLVGLNNMRANDYANVVVHILARVAPVRCIKGWPDCDHG